MDDARTDLFAGDDELRRLLREHDWSKTPLGAMDSWPRTLVGYVDMILAMPTPAIVFWGPEQTQIYNAGYAVIMGPRHPRYFGAPYAECWPDTYDAIIPHMRRVLAGGDVQFDDTLFTVTRHGFVEEAYFTFTFSPLRDDAGRVVGVFQPVVETTTAVLANRRARTLEALGRRPASSSAAVADAIAAFAGNREDVPFAVVWLWDEATSQLAHAACSNDLDADQLSRLAPVARSIFDDGRSRHLDDLASILGSAPRSPWGEAATSAYGVPLRPSRQEATRGVVLMGVSPRLRFDEAYRRFLESAVSTFADARDHAVLIEHEQHARRAAERESRAKDEFLAMLGHELRNPLAPIRTAMELIRHRLPDSSIGRQLDIIERQSNNLRRVVDDLLEVSRVTLGKIELQKERIDLNTVVDAAVEAARSYLDTRRHVVTVERPSMPVYVDADGVRIEQVITNLLLNAGKYTNERGNVGVRVEPAADRVRIVVHDDGIGIAPELLPRIFDLFQQGQRDYARSQGGLGVGLTIVRRLVELHEGTVEAFSEGLGKGAEVVVTLPVAGTASSDGAGAPPAAADDARSEAPRAADSPRRLRIVVVDDNDDAGEMLCAAIEVLGHEAKRAVDGPSGLELIERWPPDLAFLDIGLPGMDGYEMARRVVARGGDRPTLVALTGYGQESDRRAALEAGFDAHLVKPVELRAIEAVIERMKRGELT